MIDIFGIDFTSTPTRRKHITCLHARLQDSTLRVERLSRWASLGEFESFLTSPGPWLAGMDFPFGFARRFIETMGWPLCWESYISALGDMDRATFRAQLDHYRTTRVPGDKEHRRWADKLASAISPQKLYGTPVGLMLSKGRHACNAARFAYPGCAPQRTLEWHWNATPHYWRDAILVDKPTRTTIPPNNPLRNATPEKRFGAIFKVMTYYEITACA